MPAAPTWPSVPRLRPRRLPARRRRPVPQRDQHHPRLHADQPLSGALPAGRLRVRRHLRAHRRARAGTGSRPAARPADARRPARPMKLPVRQPVARGSRRRSRRGLDVVARVAGIALVVATAAGVYWFVSTDRFRLDPDQVHISGLVYTDEPTLRAAIGLAEDARPNVFRLKPAQMAEALRDLPSVATGRSRGHPARQARRHGPRTRAAAHLAHLTWRFPGRCDGHPAGHRPHRFDASGSGGSARIGRRSGAG